MTPTHNPSAWMPVTVTGMHRETPTVTTFDFALPHVVTHKAGQHYEIRLTAPDGYQAARLYSAASAANGTNQLQLTVALLKDGEVSPYLHEQVEIGDQLELRGPLGKFFIWEPAITQPVILVAGGSGIVPMRCIWQAHAMARAQTPITALYSTATYDEIIYKSEVLTPNSPVTITLTRESPSMKWQGCTGRINADWLQKIWDTFATNVQPQWYVCGSTPFVESIANTLIGLGVNAEDIKAERFGSADTPMTTKSL